MNVIDITGSIQKDMWNYEEPFPMFDMKPLGSVPWVNSKVYCEVFHGIHSQTGTYIETPAHYYGNDKSYNTYDIPVQKLVNIPCVILNIEEENFYNKSGRVSITEEMLINSLGDAVIDKKCAILVGTGWGKHWMDKCFLDMSPYFTKEAMRWLISYEPFLIGTDFPRWENLERPEGFFEEFYSADILMLAPCVNIERIKKSRVDLTVLPMNITGTSCVPCRAVVIEGGD